MNKQGIATLAGGQDDCLVALRRGAPRGMKHESLISTGNDHGPLAPRVVHAQQNNCRHAHSMAREALIRGGGTGGLPTGWPLRKEASGRLKSPFNALKRHPCKAQECMISYTIAVLFIFPPVLSLACQQSPTSAAPASHLHTPPCSTPEMA